MADTSDAAPDISSLLNPRALRSAKLVPPVAIGLVMMITAIVLVGWATKITALTTFSLGWISMRPSAALGLMLCAGSLAFLRNTGRSAQHSLWRARAGVALAVMGGLVGALTLFEYRFAVHRALDPFIFSGLQGAGPGGADLERLPPLGALCLILTSLALVSDRYRWLKWHPLSHLLAFALAWISFLPLVAYAYGSRFLFGLAAYSDIAPHSALCFLVLSLALVFNRIDHDIAAIVISDGPGGQLARRLLPVAFFLPFVLGWMQVRAEDARVLSDSFGTALFATAVTGGFVLFIWNQSMRTQRSELLHRHAIQERERLRLQSELRDQFVSMVSHDLRTPITAASTYAQLIERSPEDARVKAARIVDSLARADRMIHTMLDVQRLRAGHGLQLSIKPTDLGEICEVVVRELTLLHGNRFVFRRMTADLRGYWDGDTLRRALENLAGNAVKYGAKDGVITVSVEESAESVSLRVHNDGPTIPMEERSSLFAQFQRARNASDGEKPGWGVGLSLVRAVAEAHGGRAWVDSGEPRGTTFGIDLPRDCRKFGRPAGNSPRVAG